MKRRKISELKRRGYKLPYLTWILDRTILYFIIAIVPIMALAYLLKDSQQTLETIKKPYTPISPYKNISVKNTLSDKWISDFISVKAPGNSKWEVSPGRAPQQPIEFKECSSFGLLPITVFQGGVAQGEKTKVTVQTYSPGEVKENFQNYIKTYSTCWKIDKSEVGTPPTEIATYDGGFFFSYGDALIFVEVDKGLEIQPLIDFYVNLAASTLKNNGCAELNVKYEDEKRNPYYDSKQYTGLILKDVINTKLDIKNFPIPVIPQIKNVEEMTQPEEPLSPKILRMPTQKPSIPTLLNDPRADLTGLSKPISYQAIDPTGPGCGWDWTGLKAPVVNNQMLLDKRDEIISNAQNEVDSNGAKYIDRNLMYSKNSMLVQKDVNSWNSYVDYVNKVHDNWRWLNNERDKIYQSWETYVANHNLWIHFDERKAKALQDYNNAVTACNSANEAVTQWEAQWGDIYRQQEERRNQVDPAPEPTPSEVMVTPEPTPTVTTGPDGQPTMEYITPSPTPSTVYVTPSPTSTSTQPWIDIPERPEGCYSAPARPSIIDREKGDEPTPPILPDGVTIPNSWEKPEAN